MHQGMFRFCRTRTQMIACLLAIVSTLLVTGMAEARTGEQPSIGKNHRLPLPSQTPRAAYEKALYAFCASREYAALGWAVDKSVRDTGPWIQGQPYGTHPAVRIYYSPAMMYWLTGDPAHWPGGTTPDGKPVQPRPPKTGVVPDGAVIVKEMFPTPAARYAGWSDERIDEFFAKSPMWTVMVKDAAGSKDGWYWAAPSGVPDNYLYPFNYPGDGFGQVCLRCHGSAATEATFSDLANVRGFSGNPLTFFTDNTWQKGLAPGQYPWGFEDAGNAGGEPSHSAHDPNPTPVPPVPGVQPNPEFLSIYWGEEPVPYASVQKLPGETHDRVVAGAHGPGQFLSSDQCMGCHSGLAANDGNIGPVMTLQTGPNAGDAFNVSPYGEWRWSPMGLAGRDPIFFSQLENELSVLRDEFPPGTSAEVAQQTVNTCLSCHGIMGERQQRIDANKPLWDVAFDLNWVFDADTGPHDGKYGDLARDGISCTVCHHAIPGDPAGVQPTPENLTRFLTQETTGQIVLGPPGELYGRLRM